MSAIREALHFIAFTTGEYFGGESLWTGSEVLS